jgi:hypothetical protein
MLNEPLHYGVSPGRPYLAAWAEALQLRSGAAAGLAWLSTMIHQCDDPGAVAAELRRVLRPGSRVLVRGFFSDLSFTGLLALFPGIDRAAATFPSTASTVAVFEAAGFSLDAVHDVVEPWRTDLPAWLARVESIRHTDSALRPLHDDEFAEGVRRVTDAHRATPDAIPSDMTLRLLVLSG